ncbi:MAG: hypothetical protein ABIE74_05735 [Pseudomonadota bacterium]
MFVSQMYGMSNLLCAATGKKGKVVKKPPASKPSTSLVCAKSPVGNVIRTHLSGLNGARWRKSMYSLLVMRDHAACAVPQLTRHLEDALKKRVWKHVYAPILVLNGIGVPNGLKKAPISTVKALVLTLKETEKELKRSKLTQTEHIIKEGTQDPGPFNVRLITLTTLGFIGPAARSALPEIRRALKDKYEDFRYCAADAIKSIDVKPKR